MIFLGCDSGKAGGFVLLSLKGQIVGQWVVPIDADKEVDLPALCELIAVLSSKFGTDLYVALELTSAIYGTGKSSMMSMFRTFGNIEAALVCNGLHINYVRPKEWQKKIWLPEEIIKVKSKTGKTIVTDTKGTSLIAAQRLFPGHDFRYGDNELNKGRRTKPHDGLVDSALIAKYCQIIKTR